MKFKTWMVFFSDTDKAIHAGENISQCNLVTRSPKVGFLKLF